MIQVTIHEGKTHLSRLIQQAVRLLLDTHVFLWTMSGGNLSPAAQQAILDPDKELFLSAASYWEICIKIRLGKLQLTPEWPQVFEDEMKTNRILWLPVERTHCRNLLTLPHIHGDRAVNSSW